jgi:hypothetical protein
MEDIRWQPIETAPKDGKPVLIYGTRWRFDWQGDKDAAFTAVCEWMKPYTLGEPEWSICETVYYSTECLAPTHWMPLPAPPR